MAGLVPAMTTLLLREGKTWMAGTDPRDKPGDFRPAMTTVGPSSLDLERLFPRDAKVSFGREDVDGGLSVRRSDLRIPESRPRGAPSRESLHVLSGSTVMIFQFLDWIWFIWSAQKLQTGFKSVG
jgi:hypothetical protein